MGVDWEVSGGREDLIQGLPAREQARPVPLQGPAQPDLASRLQGALRSDHRLASEGERLTQEDVDLRREDLGDARVLRAELRVRRDEVCAVARIQRRQRSSHPHIFTGLLRGAAREVDSEDAELFDPLCHPLSREERGRHGVVASGHHARACLDVLTVHRHHLIRCSDEGVRRPDRGAMARDLDSSLSELCPRSTV